MEYHFKELVDIPKLQRLTDKLYAANSIPSAVVSMEGEVLTSTGWQRICTDFHRKHPEVEKECIESDIRIRRKLERDDDPFVIYNCPRGLVDASVPVIIEGEHVANVFSGQVLLTPWTQELEDFFRGQARRFGFDEAEYLEAVKAVPVIPEARFRAGLSFLALLSQVIADIGLSRIRELKTLDALRRSEKQFRLIAESIAEDIWQLDFDGKLTFTTRASENIFGYSPQEAVGLDFRTFFPESEAERVADVLSKALAGEPYQLIELVGARKDGSMFPVEISASPIMKDGRIIGVQGIARDLTDRKNAEREHLEIQERYRIVTETVNEGIILQAASGEILTWNKGAEDIFGIPSREAIGNVWQKTTLVTIHEDGSPYEIPDHPSMRTLRTATPLREQVLGVYKPSGDLRWISVNTNPLFREGASTPYAVTISFSDITERKQSEEKLKSAHLKLEALWDINSLSSGDFKAICDHVLEALVRMTESEYGFYGFMNAEETVMAIHSWSGDAMKSCKVAQRPHHFPIAAAGVWGEALRSRAPFILNDYAAAHPGKKGLPGGHVTITRLLVVPFMTQGRITSVAAVANRASPYNQDDVVQIHAFLNSIQAIVERKRAELERERLMSAIEQSSEAIVITDTNGTIQYINPSFEKNSGYGRREVIGRTPNILKSGVQDDRFYEELWLTITAGKTWKGRLVNRRRDGAIYIEEASISPVKDASGAIVNYVGVNRDVTREVDFERRIEQTQRIEAIGTLAGGIAHDFNNILFPITGLAEMLLEDLPPGSMERENVEEIYRAARRASELVSRILSFSRQSDSKRTPVRIQHVLNEALKLSRATIPSNIDIRQEIQPDCGLIMADPTQLHQIAMNLITNAYHAVEENGGAISVRLRERVLTGGELPEQSLEPGRYAVLTVSDTGHGIDAAIADKIFEPYFTTKSTDKGTGLGLSVVYGIVKAYGGDIQVASEPGNGATFDLYLPLMSQTAETVTLQPMEMDPTGSERILLVDDELPVVRLEMRMLERLGYQVASRTSSIEALEMFRADPDKFDLVITDMTMPNMTGDQLARELIAIRGNIPIIICTGFSEKIDPEKARRIGARGLLLKPVIRSDMAKTVRMALDSKRGA